MVERACYFYRCFSERSAGGLVSGKGRSAKRLSKQELCAEFENHQQLKATVPTALISVSTRVIDTLGRASDKLYLAEESPDKIWIAFIRVPDADKDVYHHAEKLAEQCWHKKPRLLRYEYIFTWEIPHKYVMHQVSNKTLLDRGLKMEVYLRSPALPTTLALRENEARKILDPSYPAFDKGLNLGFLARCFGARAPTRRIASQLIRDCLRGHLDDDAQIMWVSYPNYQARIEFREICDIEDGIDTALGDWWLTRSRFLDAYEEHCAWASEIKDVMEREWDVWCDAAMNRASYGDSDIEFYAQQLRAKEEKLLAKIEKAAIALGL
jgi:hypothetical protein